MSTSQITKNNTHITTVGAYNEVRGQRESYQGAVPR